MSARLLAALLAIACVGCRHEQPHVAIGVAASLRHAMPELIQRYQTSANVRIDATYGASDMLAAQFERGVALDGVLLSEEAALDALIQHGRISRDSREIVASTTIVLVGPAASSYTFATLAAMPADAKIGIGDPVAVPAGRYARSYLEKIGVWETIRSRLVYGGDVAGVLANALRGAAQVAIVYRTDAERSAPLVILDQQPDTPVVAIVGGVSAQSPRASSARAFLDFLASPEGQTILSRHGFTQRVQR